MQRHLGLTAQEVSARQLKFGKNEIDTNSGPNPLRIFFSQLLNPLVGILALAAIFSISLHEIADAFFIAVVVLLNSVLSFWQEYKAENTLALLKKNISREVNVMRDGVRQKIDSSDLVPGDIVFVESGLKVPADCRLLEVNELSVDEAILTGESEPVNKSTMSRTSADGSILKLTMIYKGSVVIAGAGLAEVEQIGHQTFLGQIATKLNDQSHASSPIKAELAKMSNIILIAISITIVAIIGIGIWRDLELKEIFLIAIALGVGMIPEGILLALTATLAIGMNRIMTKGAIVKNLPAAETLGEVDVLCVDKTGTLTEGKMKVVDVDFNKPELARYALAVCNNQTNFIDKALTDYLGQIAPGLLDQAQTERTAFFPFTSHNKYTAGQAKNELFAVGAPEVILSFVKDNKEANKELAERLKLGLRTVAVAQRTFAGKPERSDLRDMTFLGFLSISDPVRESAKDAVERIRSAGVSIKVITGDLQQTATRVMDELNIAHSHYLSGQELQELLAGEQAELDRVIAQTQLFYRTTPDQKLTIVQSLRRQNLRIAMMGDGVNDSPALKNAEIGIAVNNATDVSKEVADIILLDSNFKTIVDAIEEGRNIFYNLQKIITFLLAGSWSGTTMILLSLIGGLPLPLLPLQLLWINLIEDGLPSLALSFDKSGKNLLAEPPRPPHTSVFAFRSIAIITLVGAMMSIYLFYLFNQFTVQGYSLTYARTFVFATIASNSLLFLFSAKTLKGNVWNENIFNNAYANASVVLGLALLLVAIYVPFFQNILETAPLSIVHLLTVGAITISTLAVVELVKFVFKKVYD